MQWLESRQDQVEGGGQVRADERREENTPSFFYSSKFGLKVNTSRGTLPLEH